MKQAIRVRDELVKRYFHLPGVNVIDIGYSTEVREADRTPIVRIHVRDEDTLKALNIPKVLQGIPIQVMISNFKLE